VATFRPQALAVLGLTAMLAAACGGTSAASTGSKAPIIIGAYVPLTGTVASSGVALQQGYQLGVAEVNAAGGINGHQIQLTIKDDQGDPQTATTVAAELGADPTVKAVLGTYGSNLAAPSSAVLEKAKVANIQTLASDATMVQRGFKYLFNTYGAAVTLEDPLIAYLKAGGIKPKRVALIYIDQPAFLQTSNYIKAYLQSAGIPVVADERIPNGLASYASTVTKVKASNPDFVWTHFLGSASMKVVLTDMATQNFQPQNFFSHGNTALDPPLLAAAGPLTEGIYSGVHWWPGAPFKTNAEFVTAYRAKYNTDPSVSAEGGYQAIQILTAALKSIKDQNYTRDAVRNALSKVNVQDTVGGPVQFAANGQATFAGLLVQNQKNQALVVFPDADKKSTTKVEQYLNQ